MLPVWFVEKTSMKRLGITLLGLLGVLAALIIGRSAAFSSRQIQVRPAAQLTMDRQAAERRLAEAIRFPTVSIQLPKDSGSDRFQKFHAFLADSFPRVHRQLERETVNGDSLLFTWKGKNTELKPILLMGHMDDVPVDPATEKLWTHPPFAGESADGFIWGRGTMDDKVGVLGILEAVEQLIAGGFQPQRTVYLAFGHDEERGGEAGAANIAKLLRSRAIELDFVLDEGMNIVRDIIPGVAAPVALIGIAEKGYLCIRLTVNAPGGHSSIPPAETAIGILSSALGKLAAAPFEPSLKGPTRQMLEFLGPEMAWSKKLPLANLWLFEPLVKRQLAASYLTNATIRTTLAPTIFNAGVNENTLPSAASAVINLRILPGQTTADALEHVRHAIGDARVQLTPLPVRIEPSAVSDVESSGFKLLQRTIRETAPGVLVAPALIVADTDSRHYAGLTKNIFRFLPITLTPQDAKRYHGIDERISLEDYVRCINFYAQLIRNSQL